MKYYFKQSALKDLRKLPKIIQQLVLDKLDYYFSSDNPIRFSVPLENFYLGKYRFRVGDYRVIFDIVDGEPLF